MKINAMPSFLFGLAIGLVVSGWYWTAGVLAAVAALDVWFWNGPFRRGEP